MPVLCDVPLASRTTLGVGGPARTLVEATSDAEAAAAVAAADRRGTPVWVLGGGSNVVVADAGFPGTVVALATRGIALRPKGGTVLVDVAAGEPWDAFVRWAVEEGLAGVECLSGIPGTAGATPIQNVGAYGREVADTLVSVRAFDRREAVLCTLPAAECGLGYRDSRFRSAEPDRYLVLGITLRLRRGSPEPVRAGEVAGRLEGSSPTVAGVREAVLEVRRAKSMVVDPTDPETRSVGSFFVNPVVPADLLRTIRARAPEGAPPLPAWRASGGLLRIPAAWLIEQAGFPRGLDRGAVGLSHRHALAIVNRGGASAGDVLALAREVRDGVAAAFGVVLRPEPRFVGFAVDPLA
ncbi:MAG: UDP-N-acetylmuramate dehydrogenase [Deltaproteobacteria bacterium]|nr:UDP-N-acetylmuramate dehydrogenase [Deltaproteobacteria bacterium]